MILYERKDKETGKEYAYRVLKENIMSLELKPGELLSELELAEKLNLSRTPIREVIMRLKSEHLIDEALFMRFAVEEKVLKLACENFPHEIMIDLEKNLFAQEIIANMEGGETEFHKLDTSFHELLFAGVNKTHVWSSILNISTHYNRMRLLTQKKDSKKSVVEQHREFLNVINNKDISKVEELIDKHMKFSMKSWDYLIKHDEEISKYFK